MLELPWTEGPGTPGPGHVALASRLELRRLRDVPAFLGAALRLYRGFRREAGGVGLSLAAEPWRRTFWTFSLWDDEAAVRRYTASPAHAAVVRRFRSAIAESTFTTWSVPGEDRPTWAEARAQVQAARRPRAEEVRGGRRG